MVVSTAPRLMSAPMKRRPSFMATACVVPLPMKQSKTMSPGLDEDFDDTFEQGFRLLGRIANPIPEA